MSVSNIIDSRNNLVTKSNMLIEANYKLGVIEQKIILCLASNIQPTDSDFKTYTLPIKEFNKLLGLKGTPKYSEMRQITKELMQKVFEVRIHKKVIQVAWLSYVAYNETDGSIDIRFDPFLRPYLLQLKKEFTSYKLENVVKLKSSYAIRIYELLKQYEKLKERSFRLVDLRKMLGAEDVYPAYGNFKQRVLVPAQKELKKKTDINFEIEEIKVGRRVDKVKFIISNGQKKESIEQLNLFEDNLNDFKKANSFKLKAKKLALTMGIKLNDDIIASWEKYGQDRVLELMEQVSMRTDITNPIGYITTVLKASTNEEAAATSETELMLLHLISSFRKSKEPKQAWFVQDLAIEELQKVYGLNPTEASEAFRKLKRELFEALGIMEQEPEKISKEEMKERFDELLRQIRK
ncbi:MAG: replication initiation protein [Bacillota bacterium]|nr:replication initiation protein [Bacillota bacterium]